VLKKAGIVLAASAASLMAISPLAFAGDEDDRGRGGHRDESDSTQVNNVDQSNQQAGLITLGDVNALNDLNLCPNVAGDDVTCTNDDSITQFNDND
jgi:hypothetical protein